MAEPSEMLRQERQKRREFKRALASGDREWIEEARRHLTNKIARNARHGVWQENCFETYFELLELRPDKCPS